MITVGGAVIVGAGVAVDRVSIRDGSASAAG